MQEPEEIEEIICCLFCDLSLVMPRGKAEYLGHLFMIHRVVIADVEVKYHKFDHSTFHPSLLSIFFRTLNTSVNT